MLACTVVSSLEIRMVRILTFSEFDSPTGVPLALVPFLNNLSYKSSCRSIMLMTRLRHMEKLSKVRSGMASRAVLRMVAVSESVMVGF